MQKTKISGAAKAFRQDVLQHEPQEIFAFERASLGVPGFAIDILKRHMATVMGDDVLFADVACVGSRLES